MIYLIGGSIRTGKSSLAKKILQEKCVSVFSTDLLVGMLKDYVSKQTNKDQRSYIIQKAVNLFPELKKLIELNLELGNSDYVYEGDIILPEFVAQLDLKSPWKACFLGLEVIDVVTLRSNIGDHKWVNNLSDFEVSELCGRIISDSKYIKDSCTKFGLKYFDLSNDYDRSQSLAYEFLTGI